MCVVNKGKGSDVVNKGKSSEPLFISNNSIKHCKKNQDKNITCGKQFNYKRKSTQQKKHRSTIKGNASIHRNGLWL